MPALSLDDATTMPATSGAKQFLFAHWEGGGNTPPMLAVVRRLVGRGHTVRVLSDLCNHSEAEAAGASFASWTRIAARPDKSIDGDPLKDWEAASPTALLALLRDRMFVGPALAYAQDLLQELRRFPADVVVANDMLLGAMAGAESAGVPCVALSSNIYSYPRPGVPPFGPGFQPAKGLAGRLRDALIRTMALRVFGRGTPAFNATRRALGLGPVSHPFDQVARVSKFVVLSSTAFDFPSTSLPANVVYAGPELVDPAWTDPWTSPWPEEDSRPLVIVGFSTTFQDQAAALARVIQALSTLDVRAVVTSGPAIDPTALPSAANVLVCSSAPHNQLLPQAAAMVTHAGHGTVIRSLATGVPLLCLPMGRDQNDNAARVVARGAGMRLSPKAGATQIREAIRQILESPRYRESARTLGAKIAAEARNSRAVSVLEEVAATARRVARQ